MKLWSDLETAETLWEKDFGGKFSRMRDAEVGDLYGDGTPTLAVATHDQGVVATVRPGPDGGWQVDEIVDSWSTPLVVTTADGGEELYDYETDPNEWTNLADRAELAAVKTDLVSEQTGTDPDPYFLYFISFHLYPWHRYVMPVRSQALDSHQAW